MPKRTSIEWTDYSSNPVVPVEGGWGCSKVSPGCEHCYAETLNKRLGNKRAFTGKWQFVLKQQELIDLQNLKGSHKIFLGDMTDIFHPDVSWEHICVLFTIMDNLPQHTFQILTKRPGRMLYFAKVIWPKYGLWTIDEEYLRTRGSGYARIMMERRQENDTLWPRNIWAGVSVENQKYAPRLDLLGRVPAKVRFVSAEPLLGPLDLRKWLYRGWVCECGWYGCHNPAVDGFDAGDPMCPKCYSSWPLSLHRTRTVLDWVITGGESGQRARPCHPDWIRDIRDQCDAARTAYFHKQWGAWYPMGQVVNSAWEFVDPAMNIPMPWGERNTPLGPFAQNYIMSLEGVKLDIQDQINLYPERAVFFVKGGKKIAGAALDGRHHLAFPKVAS